VFQTVFQRETSFRDKSLDFSFHCLAILTHDACCILIKQKLKEKWKVVFYDFEACVHWSLVMKLCTEILTGCTP